MYKYSIYWEKTYCFTPPGEALDCQTYTDSDSATVNVARKPGIAGNFENFPSQDDDGVFTVKWGAATGTISRYELHQKKNSGSYSGDIHDNTARTHPVDLNNGSYQYRVRACAQAGSYSRCGTWKESPVVDVAFEPPPTGALSFADNTTPTYDKEGIFKVTWGAASGNPFTGYRLYQQKGTASPVKVYESTNTSVQEAERPDNCTNFPVSCPPGLLDGDYTYHATTFVTVGNYTRESNATYSTPIQVLQVPGAPEQINQPSGSVTTTPFTVSWDAVPGDVTYKLEYGTNGVDFTEYSSGHTSPSNPNVDLANGTYYFQVRACNTLGECGEASSPPKQVSVNVAPPVPGDPAFTSVPTSSDYGDFAINWQANGGNITHYRLQQKVNSQPWPVDNPGNDIDLGLGTETTYEANGETEGVYQFRLKACNTEASCTESWVYSDPIDVHNLQGIAPVVSAEQQPQYMATGAMRYSTDVNFRGDATISVPIQSAPGVNGLAPSLNLSYSSGHHRRHKVNDLPEDILGYGWHLSGIPEIRRCVTNRPMEDKLQLNDTDSICLSGSPLVLISGNHWQTGAVYRTLRDRFVLVEIKGTAEEPWFEVKQPSGSVRQFGATNDSRILIDNDEGKTPYYAWTLNKVTDAFGNTITYNYYRDSVSGINYPLSILYGNNNDARIEFKYATRDDAAPMAIGDTGFQQGQLVLLHHINVLLDGNILREYRLIPETAPEGWKRLDKIQHCAYEKNSQPQDPTYKCLAPLSFGWMTSASANPDEFLTAVQTVDDGTRSTTFTHELMTEGGFEGDMPEAPFGAGILPANSEVEPLQAVNGEYRHIVTSVSRSNGIGGNHITNYRYQGTGFRSKKHWGFLGYYAQGVQDAATGITTYRQFRLDFPHFGRVARLDQYDHIFGSHSELLSKQRYRYDKLVLTHNGSPTYFPFLRASLDAILEGGQELGFNYNWNSYGKAGYGTNGELLDSATHIQRVVTNASTPGTETYWGQVPAVSVDGSVERSRRVVTSFQNRTNPWLVGFVEGESEEYFDGDTGGTAERTVTAMASPFGNTNRIGSLTRFPGDTRYELNIQYGYSGDGNLSSETVSGHASAVPGAEIDQRSSSASNFLDKRYPGILTNALSQSVTVAYDQRFGLPESVTDANSRTTLTEYDPFGRELQRTNADNVAINSVYEDCNNIFDSYPCPLRGNQLVSYRVTTSSAITPTSYRYYDALNRLVQTRYEAFESGATVVQDRFFDNKGLLVEESVPHFSSESVFASASYEYDLRNRLETTFKPGGGTLRINYQPQLAQRQVLVQVE
ncbi:SpvB/TcaC N-terminal domain-containing protein [Microbulbifer sp. 2201CG32-9]|uniref:SpvB/TcaC N-terminal domain-containing protein n=1 Tax=Microbulbifer sp. 2201CG32-9 TaxID=3232309 RepID=UPI00345BEF9A